MEDVKYFEYDGDKIILDDIDYVSTRHGAKIEFHHVVIINYKDNDPDYIFCSKLDDLEFGLDKDYWVDSDNMVSIISDRANSQNWKDYNDCEELADKIRKYIDSNINYIEVKL